MKRFLFDIAVPAAGVVVAWMAFGAAAFAQDDSHGCAAPPAYIPPDLLERPVTLRSGAGNSVEIVTTRSPDAQRFYNQGLNYLESYVWIEAARSFRQAIRLDPDLAMAYVGLSRVSSGIDDPSAARRYFEKAKTLSGSVSDRERRLINIREKQLAALANLEDAAAFLAYKKAIDDALGHDVDDPQLWILRGNAEEPNASGRGQRGTASSIAFYERALALVPDHATAHHFLVHSCESIGAIDKALEHGEAYARLSPAIPHAAHMWGHDLRRVGRVDDAIAQFLKADSLERAYHAAEQMEPAFDWHHGHNLDLLAQCYQHKGQMKVAEATMRQAAALGEVDARSAFAHRELPNFLIHRTRYDEALEAAQQMTRSEFAQARAAGHALAGQARIALGRIEEARADLDAAQRELEKVPLVAPGVTPRRSTVEPWVESLRGELLLRTGKTEEGREVIKRVQSAHRAVLGPDAWSQTLFLLESMARSARELGDWDLAEFTARQMLEHDPAYGGTHLALALVLEHAGDAAGAAREFAEAERLWPDADDDLAELAVITASRAAH
jgi:tetratricopeptide (TPR) repeat protein